MIPLKHYTPQLIASIINKYVIAQTEPVKTVATALSAHLTRCSYNQTWSKTKPPLQKDNLLILGPTGTGKTESIRTVIRELGLPVPVAVIPATSLSNVGYKGKNVSDILSDLITDAKRLIKENPNRFLGIGHDSTSKTETIYELVQNGIIVLDEFDKLRFTTRNEYEAVYTKKLQNELLKLIEGGSGFGDDLDLQRIDTTNILFICLGAFSDLLNPPQPRPEIGFATNSSNNNIKPTTIGIPTSSQLVEYGFVEELIGRIPIRCRYNPLSINSLYKILAESKISPINDFERLFEETGNSLVFDQSALREIANKALTVNAGARGLRTILSNILYPILYEIDGKYNNCKIKITKYVVTGEKPVILPQNNRIKMQTLKREFKKAGQP